MRPISAGVKKRLQSAGLWANPCLICGTPNETQAEHAVYRTNTGRQGMGARQLDESWAIIPACRDCNMNPKDKDYHRFLAFGIGYELSELPMRFVTEYERLREKYGELPDDALVWVERLRNAG